eukprot:3066063-Rhodomonas_salina.6
MCGTELAYGAMGCAVLSWRMVLRDERYRASVWCYGMCSNDLVYGATAARSRQVGVGDLLVGVDRYAGTRMLLSYAAIVCCYATCGTT